jgi:hypothetical protein
MTTHKLSSTRRVLFAAAWLNARRTLDDCDEALVNDAEPQLTAGERERATALA